MEGRPKRYPGSFLPGVPRKPRDNEWTTRRAAAHGVRQRTAATGLLGWNFRRQTATVAAGSTLEVRGYGASPNGICLAGVVRTPGFAMRETGASAHRATRRSVSGDSRYDGRRRCETEWKPAAGRRSRGM